MDQYRVTYYVKDGEDLEMCSDIIEADDMKEAFDYAYEKYMEDLIEICVVFEGCYLEDLL